MTKITQFFYPTDGGCTCRTAALGANARAGPGTLGPADLGDRHSVLIVIFSFSAYPECENFVLQRPVRDSSDDPVVPRARQAKLSILVRYPPQVDLDLISKPERQLGRTCY